MADLEIITPQDLTEETDINNLTDLTELEIHKELAPINNKILFSTLRNWIQSKRKPTIFNYSSDATHTTNQKTNVDQIVVDCTGGNVNITLNNDGFEGKVVKFIRKGSSSQGAMRINGVLSSFESEYLFTDGAYKKVKQAYEEVIIWNNGDGVSSGNTIDYASSLYTRDDFSALTLVATDEEGYSYTFNITSLSGGKTRGLTYWSSSSVYVTIVLLNITSTTITYLSNSSGGAYETKAYKITGVLQ